MRWQFSNWATLLETYPIFAQSTNTNFVFCDLLTTTLPRHIPTRVTTANGAALTSLRAIIRDFPKNAKIKGCSKWWMSLLWPLCGNKAHKIGTFFVIRVPLKMKEHQVLKKKFYSCYVQEEVNSRAITFFCITFLKKTLKLD